MESVAAERLSKIGQNPAIVSTRADLKADLNLVKEIVSSVVDSEGGSDEENDDSDEGRKDKEERAMDRIRRVIQLTRSRKKNGSSEEAEKAAEAIRRHDSAHGSEFLSVPKSVRKRSHNRVFGLSSGVSKLFKRGGVFGEYTDTESEAYLSWDRARQQRYTRFHASIQQTSLHHDSKKQSLTIAPSAPDETRSLKDAEDKASIPLITDPDPDVSTSYSEPPPSSPHQRSSSSNKEFPVNRHSDELKR